jgi:hypothetical protein
MVLGIFIARWSRPRRRRRHRLITEYYTAEKKRPARASPSSRETGAATNIIAGLADRHGLDAPSRSS